MYIYVYNVYVYSTVYTAYTVCTVYSVCISRHSRIIFLAFWALWTCKLIEQIMSELITFIGYLDGYFFQGIYKNVSHHIIWMCCWYFCNLLNDGQSILKFSFTYTVHVYICENFNSLAQIDQCKIWPFVLISKQLFYSTAVLTVYDKQHMQ